MTQAARIRFARKRANLTLDRLGEIVGTSRQHLIRLESGKHSPKPEMARRIAEATGVPLELIQDEDDEESDRAMREAFDLFVALMERVSQRKEGLKL